MALRWLEHRIPPPIVMLATGALMYGAATALPALGVPAPWRLVVAILLATGGGAVALAGVLAFRRARTTVNPLRPDSASQLVVAGIYHHTRNPMYLGMALWLLAWGIWLDVPPSLLGVPAFVLYLNRFQIAPEERALQALFGADFAAYCTQVRRWC